MSTYVGRVGQPYSDNYIYRYGLNESSYTPAVQRISDSWPRILPYTGWASYKNVKSGLYNRPITTPCVFQKGFGPSPGVYPMNYDNRPAAPPYGLSRAEMNLQNNAYEKYQDRRMSIYPGNVDSQYDNRYVLANGDALDSSSAYSNYFNNQCGYIYPKRYVKGSWPDEQLAENILPYDLRNSINPAD